MSTRRDRGRTPETGNAAIGLVAGAIAVALGIVTIAAALGTADTASATASAQLRPGTVPAEWFDDVVRAGTVCAGVSAPLIAAQIEAESGWNPRAVSPVGAQGLSQFMPGTWDLYGTDGDGDGDADPFSPEDAIASQAAYDCALAELLSPDISQGKITGNPTDLMLAAYNAGIGAVRAAGGVPPYPETRTYISRITGRTAFYSAAPASTELGQRIVAAARTQLGVPYAWGGGSTTGPSEGFAQGRGTVGFDCSGLVRYAVAQASDGSIAMPRTADAQQHAGKDVPLAALQPGDLIGFTRPGDTAAHHIGIYLGAGRMIHAPQTGGVVEIISLNTRYWKGQTWHATRVS